MNATLTINQECNGLELYFPQKPDADILGSLKSAGWRYHRLKQCWYARQTEENRKLAESLAGDAGASASKPPASFFPAYDAVDGADIFRSADVSCWENDGGYFADVNAYISVRVNRIVIIDLRNALIPGRECERLVLEHKDLYDNHCLYSGLDTFRAVYDRFFVQREFPDCCVYETKLKSMNTFTPFKEIKPIKTPEKWTLPHVWKAILSGQIFQGTCDGRYTDDYAYDAAVNFRSGVSLHLPSFACKLIDSPSGWTVHPHRTEDGVVELSVSCYSFDMNTLYFDEYCDWAENIRRREQRESERNQHNEALKARLLIAEEVLPRTETGLIFDVTLLEMDDNTNRYFEQHEVMLRHQFLDGERLWRDVLDVTPRAIEDDTLYDLVCGSYVQADERVIRHDESCIVTGKALTELLTEHADDGQISAVSVRRQTISDLQSALDDQLTGRVRNLFNPAPRSQIVAALERLSREEERIHETC